MKTMKRILSMILVCALVLPMVVVTANAGETQDDSYWFTDDFSYATEDLTSMGWNTSTLPNLYVDETNGTFRTGTRTDTKMYLVGNANVANWSKYTVEVDVKITPNDHATSTGRVAGVYVAAPETTSAGSAAGYEFFVCSPTNDTNPYCRLVDRTNSSNNLGEVSNITVELDTIYTLKVEMTERQILCYIDNELMITYDVQSTDDVTGTIGLHQSKNEVVFDNVKVYSSESAPWYADTFNYSTAFFSTRGYTNSDNIALTNKQLLLGKSNGTNYSYLSGDATKQAILDKWTNYTVEADVTITDTQISTGGSGRLAGIVVAAPATSTTGKAGFAFVIASTINTSTNAVTSTDCRLINRTTNTTHETVNCSIELGEAYTLKMVVSEKQILCYVDNELKITYDVQTTDDVSGTIGFHAVKNVAAFDNVCVRSTAATPWYHEQFNTGDVATKGWTNGQSRMSVANGVLNVGYEQCNSNQVYTYLSELPIEKGVANYMVEADITITDTKLYDATGKPYAALVIGAEPGNISGEDGYQFLISMEGYARLIDKDKTADSDYVMSQKNYNCTITQTTYRLKMVIEGKQIQCYLNGTKIDALKAEYEGTDENPFAGLIGIRAGVNAVTVDNVSIRPSIQCEDNYYDVDYYRSSRGTESAPYIHPYKEGEVFAGWYTDANYTTALNSTTATGYAYAKFVDENVLSVKAQLDGNTKAASDTEKTRMRFVTTVDCLDYDQVGFVVSTPNKTATFKSSTVYETLNATGLEVPYTPDDISSDSEYFATIILGKLSATMADLDKVFTVTPFWVTADGTTVTGITRDADNNPITIQNGINANNNSSSSPYSLR